MTKLSVLALGTMLVASAASAQSYGPVTPPSGSNEVVTVTAPKQHQRQTSTIGAPIIDVSLSREVRSGDLDLATVYDAHGLRARVRHTAKALCDQLDQQYLVTEDDGRGCVGAAIQDAR